MKLLIKKATRPGRLGTITFELYTRLQVDQDELSLLDKCNLLNESIFQKTQAKTDGVVNTLFALSESQSAKVHHIIEGYTFTCERLEELVALESELKQSSVNLQQYLAMAASFDQEEVFDLEELLEAGEVN